MSVPGVRALFAWPAVLVLTLLAGTSLAACGDDSDGDDTAVSTPSDSEILAALEGIAADEGWELVGPCEDHDPDDPDFRPGTQCYSVAEVSGDNLHFWVGNVASQASHRVILQRTPEDGYAVAGVTPVLTPASGK